MGTVFSHIVGGIMGIVLSVASLTGLYHQQVAVSPVVSVMPPPQTTNEIYQGAVDDPRIRSNPVGTSSVAHSSSTKEQIAPISHDSKIDAVSSRPSLSATSLPLGDGKVSTAPKKGYVYSCQQSFKGAGAEHAGDWINGTTWDSTSKLHVEGEVYWSNAIFTNVIAGALRIITGNGLPVALPTGVFPIAQTDPAYLIDRNPNTIATQDFSFQVPATPVFAALPSCVPMGIIGIAQDGVAIFNALDASGRDAVAHEVQDLCDGHPEQSGEYHYHGPSSCMPHVNEKDTVVGFALDGFPITSLYDQHGQFYADADLDACHGTTSAIMIDGSQKTMYHYVLTREYPYTIGCFMGTPMNVSSFDPSANTNMRQSQPSSANTVSPQGSEQQPPQAAIDACTNKSSHASCSISTPQGMKTGSCQNTPDGTFACIPH